jgi:hypothetical protein
VIFSLKNLAIGSALLMLAGCGDRPQTTPAEGVFGQISDQPSTNIVRARPATVPTFDGTPIFTVLQTELSPAVLLQSDERELSFFTDLEKSGRAAPSYAAFSTRGGPRPFKNGDRLAPEEMEENWVMVWFSGARGWTNGDVPWVVYLQHRPRSMRLDTNGLHFRFPDRAGSLALLPLYGIYLCPTNDQKSATKFNGQPVQTWKWGEVLHREPLMRLRYWASALRQFPYDCEETFSVDRSTDTLTIRQKISYVSIEDDWSTKSLKLHPVSPTLALASRDQSLPVKFSQRVMDLEMPSAWGPYMAAESEKPMEMSFRVLHHINEGPVDSNTNAVEIEDVGTWSRWASATTRDHCVALARSAYRANDVNGYNYACYLFTRALTRHHFDQLLGEYSRTLQSQTRAAPLPVTKPAQPRLIPAGPPSPFVPGIEREVTQPGEPLVAKIVTVEGEWPQLVLRGPELHFGAIKAGSAVPKKSVRLPHSPTTERIVVLR